jgi:hypothetical protein
MDIRDLEIWYREAQRFLVETQIKRIHAARLAWADNAGYNVVMGGLNSQLAKLSGENTVKRNWEELKAMRRR